MTLEPPLPSQIHAGALALGEPVPPELNQSIADITLWQAIAGISALALVAGWLLRKAWPFLAAVKDFIDDWKGEDARPGHPARPGVIETLRELKKQVGTLQNEVKPNGGGSLRDAIDRVEKGQYAQVKTLAEHIEESTEDRRALHRAVDALYAQRSDTTRAVNALVTETSEHHHDTGVPGVDFPLYPVNPPPEQE